MRRTLGLLAALLLALVAPAPAHAANYSVTHDGPEVCQPDCPIAHIRVKVYSHDNGGGIIVDDIQFSCILGCGNLSTQGFNDMALTIRGSSGALIKNFYPLAVGPSGSLHIYPNKQMGKSAQWFLDGDINGGAGFPDEYFTECGAVHPSVANPYHPGCVSTSVS